MYAKRLCHTHDRSHDILSTVIESAEEHHVYLYLIKAIILQDIESGISTAEIIHPDIISLIMKKSEHRMQLIRV